LKSGDLCDCISVLDEQYDTGHYVPAFYAEPDLSVDCFCLILKVEHPLYYVLFKEGLDIVSIENIKDVSMVFKKIK
jgi:hypothetical protein